MHSYAIIFYRLTNDVAKYLCIKIVAAFPTEVATTYYVPPISKKDSVTKKSVVARGKLINMWRNRSTLNKKFESRLQKEESIEEENSMFFT